MKRERLYCFLLAIIATIILWGVTLKFIPSSGTAPVIIILTYLAFTSVIFVSILGIIKDKKSKEDWYGLIVGVDGIIMIFDFILGCFGNINELTKTIIIIVFIITFSIFIIMCGLWSKIEKEK